MGEVVDIGGVEAVTTITVIVGKDVTTMNPGVVHKAEGAPLNLAKTTRQPAGAEAEMGPAKAEVETTSTLPLIWPILPILAIWVTNHRKFGKVV